ncbi:TPA: reverse transcriptase domain-containing protein, partial [Salmonella enterica subsp. enterica serovar Enteritidis]
MAPLSILERLQNAANRQDLASILNLKTAFLTDVIYRLKAETQYTQFTIPKKNGAPRVISAPTTKLKDIQRRLADVLYLCRAEIYKRYNIYPVLSHGFEKEKSIITNAERHRGKTLLLNIDLEDYFDSFNFGRVRGFFLSNRDFRLNNTVATTIAQIACFQNGLPQ